MKELIIETRETVERALSGAIQSGDDNDREMYECLARLKVWRVENLMSPTGMDRFARSGRRGTKEFLGSDLSS